MNMESEMMSLIKKEPIHWYFFALLPSLSPLGPDPLIYGSLVYLDPFLYQSILKHLGRR